MAPKPQPLYTGYCEDCRQTVSVHRNDTGPTSTGYCSRLHMITLYKYTKSEN